MAGHSKWANIQHRKKKQDAKRGKVFTKLIRAITVAARLAGGDIDANPRLRDAVLKAKAANMPNDTIDRAIKKGSGDLNAAQMEEIIYEGYGPNGVAVMVECLTDNKNRTVAEVRHAFTKCGGNLGTSGSVAYLFKQQGQLIFSQTTDEDNLMAVALELEIEDIVNQDDGSILVICPPDKLYEIRQAFEQAQLNPDFAETSQVAANTIDLDENAAEKMLRLQDLLEDLDDVQNVYSNAEIDDQVLAKLGL
ncbi:MAG: YebC/PmpR family DNA-binding transcriptional regulator [Pseudomonadota bacterium]